MFDIRHPAAAAAVRMALDEDIGPGDITTNLTVPESNLALGAFYAREEMTVAGVELLHLIYEARGPVSSIDILIPSGRATSPGDCLARVQGPARVLLTCERVALNFMQRLSGVATLAARFAAEVSHTRCRVLDTRKTTPCLRVLEKMAAACGGATNHRMGLHDAVLIKNNHIAACGGVRQALAAVSGAQVPVEIEVRTLLELDEALACGAKRLLLDNLTPDQAKQWIERVAGRASVELSGGITLDTARAYAEAGADFISAGAITHSARALDINFRLTPA